jgi:hypothetical protein
MVAGFLLLMALSAAAVPAQSDDAPREEPPLDASTVRSLRERLGAGSLRVAGSALAAMKESPHSRHGLLLHEAMVRADLRVAGADQRLAELEQERTKDAEELDAAKRSTSTSARRRAEERLAELDSERARLAAQREIESKLRAACAETWQAIAPRLAPAAADALAQQFAAKLADEHVPASRALLVEMLGAVPSPAAMPPLMELVCARGEPAESATAALVALGRRGDPSGTPAAVAALAHPDWRVQSEAVEALRRMHRRSSIPFLIDKLEHADGRLKDDLGFALRSLTGERFAAAPATWREWWEKHQADFTMPPAPAERPVLAEKGDGQTRFFGIGTFSKRVVFVLDVSSSMDQPDPMGTDRTKSKLDVARAHLDAALVGLSSDARFDVLLYAGTVESCFPTLVPADDANRAIARQYVASQKSRSGTNIHSALLDALELAGPEEKGAATIASGPTRKRAPEVDTIFFLTDGQPTAGLVREPALLLAEVAAVNRTRRVRIHTVGVGDHDRAFLQALAEQSGGTYESR